MDNVKIKGKSKAAGLKSTFFIDNDNYLMTSFDKGAKANIEKKISANERKISYERSPKKFDVNFITEKPEVAIKGHGIESEINLDNISKCENSLHAKDTIENIFFGKKFEDNIHIQLAYNIMDIQKVLAAYAAIVVNAINNLDPECGDNDILGMLPTQNRFKLASAIKKAYDNKLFKFDKNKNLINIDKIKQDLNWEISEDDLKKIPKTEKVINKIANNVEFIKKIKEKSYYFSDAFMNSEGKFDEEKAFEVICIMGNFRQYFFHGENKKFKDNIFYNLEERFDKEQIDLVSKILDSKIDKLNTNFLKTNKVNLVILNKIYIESDIQDEKIKQEKLKELCKQYFNFMILKEYKNMGFSIKKIRENILENKCTRFKEVRYDSVRNKLNNLLDFIIFKFYTENDPNVNKFVEELRSSMTEEEKNEMYKIESDMVWESIGKYVKGESKNSKGENTTGKNISVMSELYGGNINRLKKDKSLNSIMDNNNDDEIKKDLKIPEISSSFSKTIYCLSLFLDGKEINMLLTTLIHKFDNISSFIDVIKENEIDVNNKNKNDIFKNGFCLFNNSQKIANDLRIINSIARMNKGKKAVKCSGVNIKFFQYRDALYVLGGNEEDVKQLKKKMEKNKKKKNKKDNSLRNFLINNVINNNRFVYVARFIDLKDARDIMSSKILIKYVLESLEPKQITRYCKTINIKDDEHSIENLSEELLNVKYENFKDVKTEVKKGSEEEKKKEKYKALISLYLTVLYLIVKTLVRINTSYIIAHGVLERDITIFEDKIKSTNGKPSSTLVFEYFEKNGLLNKRIKNNLEHGKNYYDDNIFRIYRNNIAHMSVITHLPKFVKNYLNDDKYIPEPLKNEPIKSMFDLYHCILLDLILKNEKLKKNDKLKEFENLDSAQKEYRYVRVSKDFLYSLNKPFAYNPSRYINLSNREKFLENFGN